MDTASLTDDEKVRIRSHLGYMNMAETYSLIFGSPAATQPQFWLEGAFRRVLPAALSHIRVLLARCDAIEQQMFDNTENHAVDRLGDIDINKDEFDQLEDQYERWTGKLANALGVLKNPWSKSSRGLNVGVGH